MGGPGPQPADHGVDWSLPHDSCRCSSVVGRRRTGRDWEPGSGSFLASFVPTVLVVAENEVFGFFTQLGTPAQAHVLPPRGEGVPRRPVTPTPVLVPLNTPVASVDGRGVLEWTTSIHKF